MPNITGATVPAVAVQHPHDLFATCARVHDLFTPPSSLLQRRDLITKHQFALHLIRDLFTRPPPVHATTACLPPAHASQHPSQSAAARRACRDEHRKVLDEQPASARAAAAAAAAASNSDGSQLGDLGPAINVTASPPATSACDGMDVDAGGVQQPRTCLLYTSPSPRD